MSSVVLRRASVVESRHRVHAAVVDADGSRLNSVGDPELVTFLRSAAKPFQAVAMVEDGAAEAFGIPASELALCCASHSGEPEHVSEVRSLLARCGFSEDALKCGPHAPLSDTAAAALRATGEPPAPIHNNCSGKHAGMLALARHHGWTPTGYLEAAHPVQRRMLTDVGRWVGIPESEIGVGVDGCGVACFAVPLTAAARGFAALAAEAARGKGAARSVLDAMAAHPRLIGGTGRLCTRIGEVTEGTVVAKVGAEGVYCASVRGEGIGIALKVEDGARRGAEVALVRMLVLLGLLGTAAREALADDLRPPVRNTRGEMVGTLQAEFDLMPTAGSRVPPGRTVGQS
jgi:L-asparaginase II